MKIKVSDYMADFFVKNKINTVFTVVGGGAMHMNDSFGHHPKMKCIYHHHEQACAMAAEGYARIQNKPALVCVTSGPGAINALNGVAGAYQDSIPMLIVSGQTKTTLLAKNSGLKLRALGNQEFDIVSALGQMTKYAETVMKAENIRYCLEKAYFLATTGRMGPCWLDVPLDIQGAYVESEELKGYEPNEDQENKLNILSKEELIHICEEVADLVNVASRPVIYAGNGIRLSGGVEVLHQLAYKINVPVVTCWDSIDLMETNASLYCGRAGLMGDRAGNFAVQNSDLVIAIGTRLNVYQVGYNVDTWARAAKVIAVDIDSEELKKKTVRIDIPICADASAFIACLTEVSEQRESNYWVEQCQLWKEQYPVVNKQQKKEQKPANVYHFMDELGKCIGNEITTVVTNGSASVVGSQSYYVGKNNRFIMNCAMSSMGYGLPAAIGVCVASNYRETVCVEGDGSIMMNLQELQTMATNKLPIKLFIINNSGYHQIRQTQNNIFHNGLIGVGPESDDLGFPDFEMVAKAFRIPYMSIHSNGSVECGIREAMQMNGPVFCEVYVSTDQNFEPKSATKRLEDGSLFSPPLEDMAPFLPREELKSNMFIPLIREDK